MSISNRISQYTMTLPEKGPLCVPDREVFVAGVATEIDLTQIIENGWLDYVSGVYIDNTANSGSLTFICGGSNQKFVFPANYSGYIPLFLPNPPKVNVTSSEDAVVEFHWYNVPVFPLLIPGPNSNGVSSNISQVGGNTVTDSLPVSFTAPTITDYSIPSLSGASETALAVGQALNYFIIQNYDTNNPVTINLAGGDASTAGITIQANGYYESLSGVNNNVTVYGTATQSLIIFAG